MTQPHFDLTELPHRLRTIQSIFTNEIEYLSVFAGADVSLLVAANEKLSKEIERIDQQLNSGTDGYSLALHHGNPPNG
jgi:hypothetical protein